MTGNGARGARPTLRVEKALLRGGVRRLGAIDEVGRGALAGPVTVGIVVVTDRTAAAPLGVRDSKLLRPAARTRMVGPIQQWADEWAVGHASAAEIDRIGIMMGLRLAATRALEGLRAPVDAVLLDGSFDYLSRGHQGALFDEALSMTPPVAQPMTALSSPPTSPPMMTQSDPPLTQPAPPLTLPVTTRVKADRDCAAVAAASVLAKTTRDALMIDYARVYPDYGWVANKGYATAEHLRALAEHGPCELHRKSWRLPASSPTAAVGDDGGIADAARGIATATSTGVEGE